MLGGIVPDQRHLHRERRRARRRIERHGARAARYASLMPSGYTKDYVELLRISADDVKVDGTTVPASAEYTVADDPVSAGTHVLTSASPFGIMGIGYADVTSSGYPGGLALNDIAPN